MVDIYGFTGTDTLKQYNTQNQKQKKSSNMSDTKYVQC